MRPLFYVIAKCHVVLLQPLIYTSNNVKVFLV